MLIWVVVIEVLIVLVVLMLVLLGMFVYICKLVFGCLLIDVISVKCVVFDEVMVVGL